MLNDYPVELFFNDYDINPKNYSHPENNKIVLQTKISKSYT